MRDENGHRITCVNGLGKTVAERCEKGMKVVGHGRVHVTKWTDASDTDRHGCAIIAEKVGFLSHPKPLSAFLGLRCGAAHHSCRCERLRSHTRTNLTHSGQLTKVGHTTSRPTICAARYWSGKARSGATQYMRKPVQAGDRANPALLKETTRTKAVRHLTNCIMSSRHR
jgi:Single-strand binding protein family